MSVFGLHKCKICVNIQSFHREALLIAYWYNIPSYQVADTFACIVLSPTTTTMCHVILSDVSHNSAIRHACMHKRQPQAVIATLKHA